MPYYLLFKIDGHRQSGIGELMKKIQTVKGSVDPDTLGRTMTHEHLLWDQRCWWPGEPEELSLRAIAHSEITIENLGQIYYHAHLHLDNIQQRSVGLAIDEAMHFRREDGHTLVDVTPIGVGRDPRVIRAVSEATGLHVIMGSGYYISTALSADLRKTEKEKIADTIVREFVEGVRDSGIKPGIIGEIGVSDIENAQELKMLKAAAIAQKMLAIEF